MAQLPVSQPPLVWNKRVEDTNMETFKKKIEQKYNRRFDSYLEFQKWSVDNFSDFWGEAWNHFEMITTKPHEQVFKKNGPGFLDNEWFSGARFNYAENILRIRDNRVALICVDEEGNEDSTTFAEMFEKVKKFAAAFRKNGLKQGDTVACYMSNVKEAIFAMLAVTSIGAIWGGPVPYYGARIASVNVKTMDPKMLIAIDYFQDDGKHFHLIDNLATIAKSSPSLTHVVIVPKNEETMHRDISDIPNSVLLDDFLKSGLNPDGSVPDLVFEQLPFDHPIAINFTSGTTGMPKGPVHSAGSLLPLLRDFSLHFNLKSGDTTISAYPNGWRLWDYHIAALSLGVTLVVFDGYVYENKRTGLNVWDVLGKYRVKFAFLITDLIDMMESHKIYPGKETNLETLQFIGLGSSPVKRQNIEYLQNFVKRDLFACSIYASTEISGALSGFDLNQPLYSAEIQAPALGVDIQCFNEEGKPVIGQRGEIVIATPYPSFPVYLWKDQNHENMKKTYLSKFQSVWSQHDKGYINPVTKGLVVEGRSDHTMKINGIRIISSDIYFAIRGLQEIEDALLVPQKGIGGPSRVVLFVKLAAGATFGPALRKKIEDTIARELWSEYVPQLILPVSDIPRNFNNKKMENIVRHIVATNTVPEVLTIKNPEILKHFCDLPEIVKFAKGC